MAPKLFDKEKYLLHYENLQLYLRLQLNLKKIHCVFEFNQSQWLTPYVEFNIQKRIEAEKNGEKYEKSLYRLMNNAVYSKAMEKLRNRINVKLLSDKKDILKWTSKPSYMSQKIFDNNLVAIRKNKVILTLKKTAYVGMCILELSVKSKCYNDSTKLVVDKMKDETDIVAIEEFVGLNPKIYSFLVDDDSEHKKAKDANKNVVATINHNEYKNVLLNNKSLRHSMNRIKCKDHRTGTYEINKI